MTYEQWKDTDGNTVSMDFGRDVVKSCDDFAKGTQSAYTAGYRAGLERAAEIVMENRYSIPNLADAVFIIKLRGSYQRPVRPKVKHREEIPIGIVSPGATYCMPRYLPSTAKLFAEWEQEEG